MKKNIVLAVISLLAALLIAETALRLVEVDPVPFRVKKPLNWTETAERIWIEYHPVLGWYSQKNKAAILESPHFAAATIHTNSSGFRGTREYALKKTVKTIRIAALGDSFVFGFGVQDQEAFPALIESRDPNREVLNIGIPGYAIDQIYLSYREIAKAYHPDIVLVGIYPQDFRRCLFFSANTEVMKPYFSLETNGKLLLHHVPGPPSSTEAQNQITPLIRQTFSQKILNQSAFYRWVKTSLIKLAKNLELIDPESTNEWLIGRAILHQLIREIRQNGSTPILVLIPSVDWIQNTREIPLEKSILRFARREKIGLINLKPDFAKAVAKDGLESYYIKDDWHWSPQGHALAADLIDQYLSSHH